MPGYTPPTIHLIFQQVRGSSLILLILFTLLLCTGCQAVPTILARPNAQSQAQPQTSSAPLQPLSVAPDPESHTIPASQPSATHTPPPPPLPTALPTAMPTPSPTSWYSHPASVQLPAAYARWTTPEALIYTSLEDAQRAAGLIYHPPAGEAYLTYTATQVVDGQVYYQLTPGRWSGPQTLQPFTPSQFAGVVFDAPPQQSFGWVLQDSWSQDGAGKNIRQYQRYDVLAYAAPTAGESPRVEIGPGEYLPKNLVSLVTRRTPPTEAAGSCRWIEIDLAEQTLQAYENCTLRFATLISSGLGEFYTPPGAYRVQYKMEEHDLSNPPGFGQAYYMEKVPYLIYFARPFALHAAYWHDAFGTPASHGCINLSPSDAAWLYAWSQGGETVIVRDEE